MKFLIVLISLVSTNAYACPGGHVKSLIHDDDEIAQIDLVNNRIRIVDSDAELREVAHSLDGERINLRICGTDDSMLDVCDNDQGLPMLLTDQPKATLLIKVKRGWFRKYDYKVTNFVLKRGCGDIVPDED
jgi:hypothetical protein